MADAVQSAVAGAGQSFDAQPVGVAGCPQSSQTIVRRAVTTWLSFHPILFRAGQVPGSTAEFTVQESSPYKTEHLLGDGRSRAIVQLTLIQLPACFVVKPNSNLAVAGAGWHANEGTITLALSDPDAGTLSYKGQKGRTIRFPVAEVASGTTGNTPTAPDAILFTAGTKLADADLTVTIEGMSSWDYLPGVLVPTAPAREGRKHSLKTGVRAFGKDAEGWDVLKAQWYLRRFDVMAHDLKKVKANDTDRAWQHIAQITTTGKLAAPMVNAVKEYQLVALSPYRNRARKSVPVTFTGTVTSTVTPETAVEMARWDDAGHKVECYHGDATLKIGADNAPETIAGRIAYAVIHDDTKPLGYVEIKDPIGTSSAALPGRSIDIVAEWHSAIRLFDKETLIWRLHDADAHDHISNALFNPSIAGHVKQMMIDLRRQQKGDYDSEHESRGCRDVFLGRGYQTYHEQDDIYAKGRTVSSGIPCGCKYPSTPSLPCPIHGATLCHDKIPLGRCQIVAANNWHHELGHYTTAGPGGHSWHNFGVAFDIQQYSDTGGMIGNPAADFYTALGNAARANTLGWGGDWNGWKDWAHVQAGTIDKAVPGSVRHTYDTTQGDVPAKLQAVWTSLGI